MTSVNWEAIGAIASVLAFAYAVVRDWGRIRTALAGARQKSVGLVQASKQALAIIAKRAARLLIAVIASTILLLWIRDNLDIATRLAPASWAVSEYLHVLAAIVSVVALLYVGAVEPIRRSARFQHQRDILLGNWMNTSAKVPALPMVFYDPSFASSWITRPDLAAAYFAEHGFMEVGADELHGIMMRAIDNRAAPQAAIVFCSDVVPASIAEVRDPSCTLRRFLEAGGRVVWWGDIPLHWRGLPGQMKEQWLGGPPILQVDHYRPLRRDQATGIAGPVLWDRHDLESMVVLTDAGRAIALAPFAKCYRPALVRQSTIVYSELAGDLGFGDLLKDSRIAISFRMLYDHHHPHSGFMQFPAFPIDCTDQSIVKDYFRFAIADWSFLRL
jgi:hypothetical protein